MTAGHLAGQSPGAGPTLVPAPGRHPSFAAGALLVLRAETSRLAAQVWPSALLLLCVAVPFVLLAAVRLQDRLPVDTLLGRWVGESGSAVPFVVLGLAALWALPTLAAVAGGDVFSTEDRRGTWDLVLTRSRTRGEVAVGKLLTSVLFSCAATVALAVSSVLAATAGGGGRLVLLDGSVVGGGRAAALAAAAWLTVLPTVIAFTLLAALFSLVGRTAVVGVGGPLLVALACQGLALVDLPQAWRRLLPTTAFEAWHLLVLADPDARAAIASAVLALAYGTILVVAVVVVLTRRDER